MRPAFDIPAHDAGYAPFVHDDTLELIGIQHRRVVDENGETVWKTLYLQVCNAKEVRRIKRRLSRAKKPLLVKFRHKRKVICNVKID